MTAEHGRPLGAVFLDRDGVINRKPAEGTYVQHWSELDVLPGVVEALQALSAAGRPLFVMTNQRGVARGLIGAHELADMHARLTADFASAGVELHGIYVCPHEADSCECRKPGVGLFLDARRDHPWISFEKSDLIGDSLSDLQAGARLGMRLWLVGDDERSRAVARDAQDAGIHITGSAPSLQALVEAHKALRVTEPTVARP